MNRITRKRAFKKKRNLLLSFNREMEQMFNKKSEPIKGGFMWRLQEAMKKQEELKNK